MSSWSMEKIFIFNLKWKTLFVLDNVTPHYKNNVKDWIKECGTALSVISSRLTWKLQLLNISFNEVFKESLRSVYAGYWTYKSNIKGTKSAIIKWIDELWHSDSVITNEMLFDFFLFRN